MREEERFGRSGGGRRTGRGGRGKLESSLGIGGTAPTLCWSEGETAALHSRRGATETRRKTREGHGKAGDINDK